MDSRSQFNTSRTRAIVNPHDDDIISGGLSRLKFGNTSALPSPTSHRKPQKLDVIYDTGKMDLSDLLSDPAKAGQRRATSMLHHPDPSSRPLANNGIALRPLFRRDNESLAQLHEGKSERFKEIVFKSKRREKVTASIRQNINRSALL